MSCAFPRMLSTELCRGPPNDFEIKFVLNNGRNKFSFSCPCAPRNIVTHGQLKENLYIIYYRFNSISHHLQPVVTIQWKMSENIQLIRMAFVSIYVFFI
jgi:hypothetical protein